MLLLVGVALFFAVGGGIWYVKNQTQMSTYTSEFMKMQFTHPTTYLIEEKITSGDIISKSDQVSKLRFGKYGTNYMNAVDHVTRLIKLNNMESTILEEFQSPYSAAVLNITKNDRLERAYFFVKDYGVYYFSTDDPTLFSDLDAIVKSFRILD